MMKTHNMKQCAYFLSKIKQRFYSLEMKYIFIPIIYV